ncbi:subunit A of transcription initiation factor [Tubulinosema ratisbonensis]|uniref:Subunit A of transcription initiation factor n=1 Tax=Tubulinosema ratisbonensis TaxID=291195 RepID=A0A437ALI7_9MICR|nr:subunit A of transcription initiation factor [Tubulinosema ratisbonensis]
MLSNISYSDDKSLIPRKNLINLLSKQSNTRIEPEVCIQLQRFSEKMLSDVLSRASLLTKLKKKDVISGRDVEFIFEKEFDFCFGKREVVQVDNPPNDHHTQKVADVKNNKNFN